MEKWKHVQIRLSEGDLEKMRQRAKKLTDGNLSKYLRYASKFWEPTQEQKELIKGWSDDAGRV